MSRRYVLIAPCRDEEQYMRRTLDSLAAQTLPPALCVVVDDGSTDATPQILAEYAQRLPWLKIVTRANRGRRAVGPGVIEAFYAGLETVDLDDFDYVCKLDLDLDLDAGYFEALVEKMEAEPRLGTFSGKPYVEIEGRLIPEPAGDEMSVGMTKFFRTACFRQIGGFVREVMWDGIDCHRARLMGWLAGSSDSPKALRFQHLRPMGSSQVGIHTGRQRHGFGQWFMGTGPLYILASSVFRMAHPPYLTGGLSMLLGYLKAAWNKVPRYEDLRFRRFLRRYQWLMLSRGKAMATRQICAEQAWAFDPGRAPPPMGDLPLQAFPVRTARLPRQTVAGLKLDAPDSQSLVQHLHTALNRRHGGWAHAFNDKALLRYRRDHAYAQLLQAVDLALAPSVDWSALPESLAQAQAGTVLTLTHEPAPGAERLPRVSADQGDRLLTAALDAIQTAAATLVVLKLDSPAQEWLASRLRQARPQLWVVSTSPAS